MAGYEIVNMFAEGPFAGSALAVVPEADGLSSEAMGLIAREINCAETAFVLPPACGEAGYRVRVFTSAGESPFGGHSSIGTACTLVRLGRIPAGEVVQECGPRLSRLNASAHEATLTARTPLVGGATDPQGLLAACGLDGQALAAPAGTAGFGPLFHFLPVREQAVSRAGADIGTVSPDIFLFSWSPQRRSARARLFAPGYGIPEDPACAPAALGLGVWLTEMGWLPPGDGTHAYRIDQGLEVCRPASLTCTVTIEGGRPTAGTVTGRVVPVATGSIVG